MRIIFFLTAIVVIFGINGYVYIRGLQALPSVLWVKIVYSLLFWSLILTFILRMYYGDKLPGRLSELLSAVGFPWIVAVIYIAIFCLCLDIIRIVNYYFDIYPLWIKGDYNTVKLIVMGVAVVGISLILTRGSYRFNHPDRTEIEIALDKVLPEEGVKLVLVSDIHLSSSINSKQLSRYIEMINEEEADVVLIVGDLVDRDIEPLLKWNIGERLSSIRSKYGVYFVSGNHEFYGGTRVQIVDYLRSSGINVLIDSVAVAGDLLVIAGRDDRTNARRKELGALLDGIDCSKPLILLDHQPFHLGEAEAAGVDLQLSGHTHNGQFWPGNLIVKMIYELPYGYMQKGRAHYYVTSGLGLWGPKFRIGTKSEMVVIMLQQVTNINQI